MPLDGTRIVIGAPLNDGVNDTAGHARVYDLNPSGLMWEQIGDDILIARQVLIDLVLLLLVMSSDGTRVVIGGNDTRSGHVCVYDSNTTEFLWKQVGNDIDGEALGDHDSGSSVDISSDGARIATGAPPNDGKGNLYGMWYKDSLWFNPHVPKVE